MTQYGETEKYTVTKHIQALLKHAPNLKLDYVIANNYKIENDEIIARYSKQKQEQVLITEEDIQFLKEQNISLIESNTIENLETITETTKYIKHNTEEVAKKIIEIFLNTTKTKEFKRKNK